MSSITLSLQIEQKRSLLLIASLMDKSYRLRFNAQLNNKVTHGITSSSLQEKQISSHMASFHYLPDPPNRKDNEGIGMHASKHLLISSPQFIDILAKSSPH